MVKQLLESILTPTYNIYYIQLHISKFTTYMNIMFINGLLVRLRRQWTLFSTHRRSTMAMVNQVNYCCCLVGCCVCSWSSIPTIISNHVISIPFHMKREFCAWNWCFAPDFISERINWIQFAIVAVEQTLLRNLYKIKN